MKLQHNIRVIISGGGTGGHIFPAVSIAQELKCTHPDVEILFVGALGRMEMEKVPALGFEIKGLPIIGFPRKPGAAYVKFIFRLLKSLFLARKILHEFEPDVAVGVGGYASGALLYMASRAKIPCLIQEQNSYAGITNKLLRKRVQKVCVAYPGMERFFPKEKILLTGNPIRDLFLKPLSDPTVAKTKFNIPAGKKVILMLGGSLGARTLNESVKNKLDEFKRNNVFLVWQSGGLYFKKLSRELPEMDAASVFLTDFIYNMDEAFAAADLIISRAGAGTISELCIVGKPVVLVPSPNVAEDHQTKNAMALVERGAARMVTDNEANEKLVSVCLSLIDDDEEKKSLGENIQKLALPEASKVIANETLKLINR